MGKYFVHNLAITSSFAEKKDILAPKLKQLKRFLNLSGAVLLMAIVLFNNKSANGQTTTGTIPNVAIQSTYSYNYPFTQTTGDDFGWIHQIVPVADLNTAGMNSPSGPKNITVVSFYFNSTSASKTMNNVIIYMKNNGMIG